MSHGATSSVEWSYDIANEYRMNYFAERGPIFTNDTPVESILKNTGGDPSKLTDKQKALKPDITNTGYREVFEVKPDSPQQLAAGKSQVNSYRDALNAGMPGNRQYVLGIDFSGEGKMVFSGGKYVYRLTWHTAVDDAKNSTGVILYKIDRLNPKDPDSKDSWKEAAESNAWVVPSDAELAALDIEGAYKAMVGRENTSNNLTTLENIVSIPVTIIGVVMTAVLSAAIFSGMGKQPAPGAQPGVPAQGPAPGPAPVVPNVPTPPPAPVNIPPPYQIPPPSTPIQPHL